MKKFEAPKMDIQRLDVGDVIAISRVCAVEAFDCPSCYCVAVDCGHFSCSANTECGEDYDW